MTSSHRLATVPDMATCPGALIVHADNTVMACTEDDEPAAVVALTSVTKATRSGVGPGPCRAATTAASSEALGRARSGHVVGDVGEPRCDDGVESLGEPREVRLGRDGLVSDDHVAARQGIRNIPRAPTASAVALPRDCRVGDSRRRSVSRALRPRLVDVDWPYFTCPMSHRPGIIEG